MRRVPVGLEGIERRVRQLECERLLSLRRAGARYPAPLDPVAAIWYLCPKLRQPIGSTPKTLATAIRAIRRLLVGFCVDHGKSTGEVPAARRDGIGRHSRVRPGHIADRRRNRRRNAPEGRRADRRQWTVSLRRRYPCRPDHL